MDCLFHVRIRRRVVDIPCKLVNQYVRVTLNLDLKMMKVQLASMANELTLSSHRKIRNRGNHVVMDDLSPVPWTYARSEI